MKSRVNLTLDKRILVKIKFLAKQRKTSVSQIVESYLEKVVKKESDQSIIEIIEKLPKPSLPDQVDLKEAYYENKLR
ncbi:MAG: DUF6364 family protein [Bacteroidota bacterium]